MLCASVHLHGSYADHVFVQLLAPSPLATCPPWGVDAVWLARHAVESQRRRQERDIALLWTFLGMFAVAGVVLVLSLAGQVQPALAVLIWLLVLLVGPGIAVALVYQHYRVIRQWAIDLAYEPEPPGIPALEPATEARLDALGDANTVLFNSGRPFVGSGTLLDHWTMTLDITTGTPSVAGIRTQPVPFDGLDLQRHLLEAIPLGLRPMPTVANRLYVRGQSASGVPFIFPHGPVLGGLADELSFRRPVNTVPDVVLRRFQRKPNDVARVYSIFELRSWGGQVVVTLFVRTFVVRRTLFIEVDLYAQRPLKSVFVEVKTIRMRPNDVMPTLLRSVLPVAMPLLMNSPGRLWKQFTGSWADARELVAAELEISRRRDVNFGAAGSIRQEAGGGLSSDQFQLMDEHMFYQTLSRRVLACAREFLTGRGVDPAEFDEQADVIRIMTTNNAREIYGGAVVSPNGGPSPDSDD